MALPPFPHTLQFTITRALGFSVFTSRILATDFITVSLSLHITHEVFFAHFLPLFCNCQLNSIPLLPSSHPGRLTSRNWSLLDYNCLRRPSLSLCNPSARTMQKTQPLYCWEGLFTDLLASNGVLLLRAYAPAGMCLPSRCLAMSLYVTIYYIWLLFLLSVLNN
jgi:hypothetical protein